MTFLQRDIKFALWFYGNDQYNHYHLLYFVQAYDEYHPPVHHIVRTYVLIFLNYVLSRDSNNDLFSQK